MRTWGSQGAAQGQLNYPIGVAVSAGEVFVADCGNDRIQVFRLDGTFVRTWGSQGAAQGQLNSPIGVAVSAGEVFVAEYGNHRIQVFR